MIVLAELLCQLADRGRLPVPLTPTTRITVGSALRSRRGGPPRSSAASSLSAAPSSATSRASSRWTSSAVVGTPTSAAISASSSRSQASSSPGSNAAAAICSVRCPAALAQRVAEAREEAGLLVRRLVRGVGVAEKLAPAPGHRGRLARAVTRRLRRLPRVAGAARRPARRRRPPSSRRRARPPPPSSSSVGDDDELRAVGEAPQQLDEAADVRVVERRFDLVQEVERAGRARKSAKRNEIAPSAFSPPESSESRVTRLPAGRSSTSIPGAASSSSPGSRRSA